MMMKIFTRKSATAQKGSTLVEASVVVVIAGLMLTGVTNGQSMLETTRATKLLNDVKSIEALLGHFETAKGRLPGDCNSDGLIGAGLNSVGGLVSTVGATAYSLSPTAQTTRAQLYSFSGAATVANLAAGNDTHCPAVAGSAAAETNVNVWVNDLRANNFIGANTVPRLFAKHIGEDMIFVGSFGDAATGETYNAMTLVNVPAAMAQRLIKNINGNDSTTDFGQMRVINNTTGNTYVANAFAGTTTGSVVNLVYFYRNQPRFGA